ncbi:LCP family protein [Microbacterium ulmi]|uniref:LytR family transcriptional regulator n=1 Tax=Microbacterium ulmi TaxID=179095 RepID=A0A7Y2Q116_9MICO|nr:LCP family protein [Microbacterium ulmi]NII69652.1 LCP family protein required for cell wall assembly [Microbacterium ulmi]NNH03460.1 LytR family transcriptional regulator [Microbacterium ulmi]
MARRRHTVARHAHLRSPHPLAQFGVMLVVAVAVAVVSAGGVAAFASYDLVESFSSGAVEIEGQPPVPPDIGAIEGGVNVLVTGIDQCEEEFKHYFGARCKGPDAAGKLNDVNLLVHISDKPRRVTVISFPRDLMVQLPSCTRPDGSRTGGGRDAINAAYTYGGLSCVVKTVSQLSGLNIHFAAMVTFGGVIEITDAIGGVDVCLQDPIRDRNTGLNMEPGTHTVSGVTALQFLRTRYGVGDGSDLGRISNQQQYMSRLARKLMSEDVLSNPATLYKLASVALSNVTPSTNLTNPMTVVQIALAVKDVPFGDIVFLQYPTLGDPSNPNKVVPNLSAAADMWAALETNKRLQITGAVGANGAVVDVTQPSAPPAEPDPAATGDAAAPPAEEVVELPKSITGSTADQQTCSARKH